jgi:hypothetical protein
MIPALFFKDKKVKNNNLKGPFRPLKGLFFHLTQINHSADIHFTAWYAFTKDIKFNIN